MKTRPRATFALLAAVAVLGATLGFGAPAGATTIVGAGTHEESSTAIAYTGTWKSLASGGSSGGAIRYASASASAKLTFTGPNVTWYTWRTATAGITAVYLDGVLRTTVDNYAATTATKIRAFSAFDLGAGTHTLELRSTGTKNVKSTGTLLHLDSIVVGESTPASDLTDSVSSAAADCPAATVTVATSAQLTTALASARPGSVIQLAPGTYTRGFQLSASGTADAPIWICGPRSAKLQGVSIAEGAALRLNASSHVRVSGFTVEKALQGVMVKFGNDVSVADLNVRDIGYEGIHLYAGTRDSAVVGNLIERTGSVDVAYGEGVYIGTSQRRWAEVTGGQPDRSDANLIAGNTIVTAGAESIEAKEGTSGGIIRDNVLLGHQPGSRAIGWVLVGGSSWSIVGNTGTGAIDSGYGTIVYDTWGTGNTWRANTGAVDAAGYGVKIQGQPAGTTVACDNRVTGAASGFTNLFCAP